MAELPSRTEMSMVEIPAGTYEVGSSEEVVQRLIDICLEGPSESSCAAAMYEDQIPPHTVRLDTFFMDRTEVTNQQFSRCVEAGACRPSRFASSQAYNQPQQPVVGVTVAQAEEFCAWRGGRLPTEAEWEYAARRSHGGAYPWGNESPTPERAAYCDADCVAAEYTVAYTGKKRMAPDPAESHGAGRSVDGLYGLAGNVWEWTADAYDSQFYRRMGGSEAVASPRKDPKSETSQRVIRGGSWKMSPVFLDSRFRRGREPDKSADDVGFRCVAVTLLPGMAEIPGGTFSRGIAEADLPNLVVRCMEDANLKKCSYKTRFGDQIPRHPVTLSAYTIDLFPVTNRMWAECVAKGPCLKSGSTAIDGLNHPDQPVTMVDWDEARTGCESQGKRLCTESEWEVAAIGNQRGALYPWGGTELTPQLANYCSGACAQVPFKDRREDPSLVPGPVLSNPKNVSPWGVFDMAGNVHQWTADHWVESAYRKCRSGCDDPHQPVTGDKDDVVVRGGSFMDGPTKLTSTYRSTRPRHLREKNLGIRCCQSR
jgi:formylglycine-generating enzyme required for sulfatase activity